MSDSNRLQSITFEADETAGLVSIVIPAHRSERFIGETLAAVAQQTYRRWEVLVVEDGSADGTEKIVRSFARRHPWHRVVFSRNERNQGPAHTRNTAFAKAHGQYIAMLDSDDRWLPEHLEVAVNGLETSGKDIAYSSALILEDQTDMVLGVLVPNVHELANFNQSLVARNLVPTSASVMRRKVVADVGPWNIDLRHCDDFEFWLRCAMMAKQFHFIGGCRCIYRKNHAGAVTQRWCSTWEESAMLTERFMDLPGTRPRTSRKWSSNSYELAARLHAGTDPTKDSSADRSRAPKLLWKAWRLRPKRVSYLIRAAAIAASESIRRKKPPVLIEKTAEQSSPLRAAA
jgi:glycosyltransferase involved in cell wall biosynthesis